MFSNLRSKKRGRDELEEPEPRAATILNPDRETLGLFPLNDTTGDTEYNVDVVAVHGLGGDWEKTWTDTNGKLWLKDFLPAEIPNARVLSYGYNSRTAFSKAVTNITDEAIMLLDRLDGERHDAEKTRPIIFISHSLGGIVVKKALVVAHERSGIYGDLLGSVRGSIFLGVPHRGSDVAYWGSYAANLLKYAQLGFGTNTNFVEALQRNSQEFAAISEQFIERGANLKIRTFYETEKMGNQLIVDKDSASLGLPNERSVGIAGANHRTMCKFASAGSQKYIPVRNAVTDLVKSAIVVTTTSHTISTEESACLQCFYTSDYQSHKGRNPSRIPGTCEWFLRHPKYLTWKEAEYSSLLWVSADPGCGKSVLSSFLVDVLKRSQTSSASGSTVCYFFFKDDNDAQRSASHALSAILHQLCDSRRQLIQYPLEEYRKKNKNFVTEIATLWKLIMSATAHKDCGTVICILDGLDECQAESRNLFLDALVGFYCAQSREQYQRENGNLKFLVTSRPYPAIERRFHKLPTVRLKAEDETASISGDIACVVTARVKEIGEIRRITPTAQSKLTSHLINNADRTFLWVSLILRMVEESARLSREALDKIITTIPSSLDAIYEKILAQSIDVASAQKLLHIVLAAVEPFTPQQLNIAFCIDEHHQSSADLMGHLEPDIEATIKDLCGLFVRVINNRVYLIHQTAKEFLAKPASAAPVVGKQWRHSLDKLDSNRILARSCICYVLLYARLDKGIAIEYLGKTEEEEREIKLLRFNKYFAWKLLQSKPFRDAYIDYAGAHWHIHLKRSGVKPNEPLCQAALLLCDPGSRGFELWTRGQWAPYGAPTVFPSVIDLDVLEQTSLTTAVAWGLDSVINLLLQQDSYRTVDRRRDGLIIAARGGNLDAAKILIENGKDCLHMSGKTEMTPLHYAAQIGNEELVKLLIDNGASIDMAGPSNLAPLHLAVMNGNTDVVKTLLRYGATVDAVDHFRETSLFKLSDRKSPEILEALLKAKANIEHRNCFGCTPLIYHLEQSNFQIAECLYEKGASTEGINGEIVAKALARPLVWYFLRGEPKVLHCFQLVHSIVGRPLLRYGVEVDLFSSIGFGTAEALWTQLYTYGKVHGDELQGKTMRWTCGRDGDEWVPIEKLMRQMNVLTVPHPGTGGFRWKTGDELITHQVHELKDEDVKKLLVRRRDKLHWLGGCNNSLVLQSDSSDSDMEAVSD